MSGLCGYLNSVRTVHDGLTASDAGRRALAGMAGALTRFDASPVQALAAASCGVAVAAAPASASLHRQDGLLVAVWGRPMLDGSDADVAARLARRWNARGAHVCDELSGPFALCILDALSGQALLAIDRSGVHTLSYRTTRQGLVFASSAAALQAYPGLPCEVDPQAIYDYLYFHTIPAPRTIFMDQQRLQPGEYLHYRRGAAVRASYWKMTYDEGGGASFGALKTQFLSTLEDAVGLAIPGGAGEPGAFLSGGTDSSTLAGMLCKVGGAPARSYSIGFDVPGYDEMQYARIAAGHFGTRHHELYVTADDVLDAIPRIAAICDQPFGNSSVVPAYYCARMARADGVTRLLGGDGGDELFGGNERYARQAVFARYERLPSPVRQLLLEPLLFGLAGRSRLLPLRKARSYIEQALVPMPARLETYNLLQHYGVAGLLDADFLAGIDSGAPLAQLNEHYSHSHGLSQINRMQALDLRYTLADNDLRKVGKACELAGVEVAFPFLDDRLLAFSAGLAPEHKLRGTRLRPFFKRALHGFLPPAILRKKKHGFGLPFGQWLHSHAGLRGLAFDSLSELKSRRIVRADFIDLLTGDLLRQHPAYHGTMVWVLMMLEQWLRQYDARSQSHEGGHDEFKIRQG